MIGKRGMVLYWVRFDEKTGAPIEHRYRPAEPEPLPQPETASIARGVRADRQGSLI